MGDEQSHYHCHNQHNKRKAGKRKRKKRVAAKKYSSKRAVYHCGEGTPPTHEVHEVTRQGSQQCHLIRQTEGGYIQAEGVSEGSKVALDATAG
mmetsp:Transcript_13302/g.34874  ORF Transcript_13302/g.34874 Transcript_13302/m.34874 type:complete len:93 (-) Transcript_13302:1418-1696(-)